MPGRPQRYIQGHLFEPWQLRMNRPRPRRSPAMAYSRVTRDPAVAQAHAQAAELSQSVKLGLAMILAGRSPEERAALRARLERPRVA